MSKEQTDWVMVPRDDAEDARDLLRLYGNNADWAALAARFDKHCAAPPEAQAVAWLLTHPLHGETLSQHPITDGDRSLGWTDTPLYASPSPAGGVQGVTLSAAEMQILDRLKCDNTHDGVRSVIESDFEPWFSLSERGLIAMEQHARGIIPHITRLGVRSLTAALSSQAQTTGGVE